MPRGDKVASLLDENQRLRARLKRCDEARQEAERQIEELQRRVRRKESEWMAEYDKHVQALLEIIKYNEEEKKQLKESEERWRKAAEAVPPLVTKCTRSSQTETPLRAEKLSSVRFAEEERPSVDAKTKVKIARMQVGTMRWFRIVL
ncbi:hypothetical protein DVH05_002173 [Phytophthora capsici]|nr:hypothetical protein DVH05_002173 [Phytophthora capsici]